MKLDDIFFSEYQQWQYYKLISKPFVSLTKHELLMYRFKCGITYQTCERMKKGYRKDELRDIVMDNIDHRLNIIIKRKFKLRELNKIL
jgi:hypothetical protein